MQKVIVTGGAGFIGSHLAGELAERGYKVGIIDDLSTGSTANIPSHANIDFLGGTIRDIKFLQEQFQGAEYIFHQAALPSVPRSIRDPYTSHEVNATGTLNVLIAARDANVSAVIYASSSSVYGDTEVLPKKEDMRPAPLSPYAVTKLTGEHYCQVFQHVYKLRTVALRYFNVYGPRQSADSEYAAVIPKFLRWAANGQPPVIYGDGSQTRDFTFVKNVVEVNILAAENGASGIFNVGSGTRISLNELARTVIALYGKPLTPVHEPARTGDVHDSLADISKAAGFGYAPGYPLNDGLQLTMKDHAK